MLLVVTMALGVGNVKPAETAQMTNSHQSQRWSARTFCSRSELDYELVMYSFENMQEPRDT